MIVGFNPAFLIEHSAGLSGMPRRVYDHPEGAGLEPTT
jgi:heme/copper-type cytochrome/quinol oxidase subunit 1